MRRSAGETVDEAVAEPCALRPALNANSIPAMHKRFMTAPRLRKSVDPRRAHRSNRRRPGNVRADFTLYSDSSDNNNDARTSWLRGIVSERFNDALDEWPR